jgi:hypothetical protein
LLKNYGVQGVHLLCNIKEGTTKRFCALGVGGSGEKPRPQILKFLSVLVGRRDKQ